MNDLILAYLEYTNRNGLNGTIDSTKFDIAYTTSENEKWEIQVSYFFKENNLVYKLKSEDLEILFKREISYSEMIEQLNLLDFDSWCYCEEEALKVI